MLKVSQYNTIYFLRYMHQRFMKQYNTLKSSLLLRKGRDFKGRSFEDSQDQECEIFRILLLYKLEHIKRFSNLHKRTFNFAWWCSFLIGLLSVCSASSQIPGISFSKFLIQSSIWQFVSLTKYLKNAQYIPRDDQHKLCYNNYKSILKANDTVQ